MEENKDLVEITNIAKLKEIRLDFEKSCSIIPNPKSPQICGTVVATDPNLKAVSEGLSVFDRKLLMMRADIFTMFSMSMSKDFVSDQY